MRRKREHDTSLDGPTLVGTGWYVARTKPQSEYLARDYLEARGIECFLPTLTTPMPRRGRKDAPLFPGYLFARYDLGEWGTEFLRWGHGLVGIVAFDGFAPAIPADAIDALRYRVEAINAWDGAWIRFQPGDAVAVRLGSRDSEHFAEVATQPISPKGRVRVLLEFMGRLTRAEVPWQYVRPLGRGEYMPRSEYTHIRRRITRGRGRRIGGSRGAGLHDEPPSS